MIKFTKNRQFADNNGEIYPFSKLDYLMEHHDGEYYVISRKGLIPTHMTEIPAIENGEEDIHDKWELTYLILSMYSKILVNDCYVNFSVEEMESLQYFFEIYRRLDWNTYCETEDTEELKKGWDQLKNEILDNIETLIIGSIGL